MCLRRCLHCLKARTRICGSATCNKGLPESIELSNGVQIFFFEFKSKSRGVRLKIFFTCALAAFAKRRNQSAFLLLNPALLEAMGINRQSMYDTFGDKRRLYLDALQQYNADSVSDIIRSLNRPSSPLEGLEAALISFASRPSPQTTFGCIAIRSICDFGRSDPETGLLNEAAGRTLRSAFERRGGGAQDQGGVGPDRAV